MAASMSDPSRHRTKHESPTSKGNTNSVAVAAMVLLLFENGGVAAVVVAAVVVAAVAVAAVIVSVVAVSVVAAVDDSNGVVVGAVPAAPARSTTMVDEYQHKHRSYHNCNRTDRLQKYLNQEKVAVSTMHGSEYTRSVLKS